MLQKSLTSEYEVGADGHEPEGDHPAEEGHGKGPKGQRKGGNVSFKAPQDGEMCHFRVSTHGNVSHGLTFWPLKAP